MTTAQAQYVVIVTPTIMSGTVVRWYSSLSAAERGDEFMSASRSQVRIDAELSTPAGMRELAEVIGVATAAMEHLRRDDRERVQALATHKTRIGSRELIPLVQDGGQADG